MSLMVKILKPVIVTLFLAMTLITFLATLARMMPALPSFYWAGEVTRYINFWITCLGIVVALHLGSHFRLTMVTDHLSAPVQKMAAIISQIGVLVLFGVMIHFGIQMITWNYDQLSAAMELPMSYVYAAIPICGALVVLQTLVSLYRTIFNINSNHEDTGNAP
jgi:TRAP-type C4-dicarboxylate transport system permease small subunit